MKEDGQKTKAELLSEIESLRGYIAKLELAENNKTAPDETSKSDAIYRMILENGADGVLIADVESKKIIICNPKSCQMFGYRADQIKKLSIENFFPNLDVQAVLSDFAARSNGFITERCIPLVRKDGSVFYADVKSFLLQMGGRTYLAGLFRDVTERKKAEDTLKQSEETFRLAMEVTNDALWDWDMRTNEVYRNPRHETMLGYEHGELSNSQDEWETRIHPDDKPLVKKILDEHLSRKRAIYEIEYRLRKKSGDYVWVLGRGKVVKYDEKGMPLRMIGTNIDITERKKMEYELADERNKHRSILKFIDYAVTIFDLDYTVIYLNDYARKFNAVREGEKCYRVFAGRDKICDDCLVELAYKDGSSHTSTKLISLPNGEKIWWENTASLIRDDNGKIIYCLEVGKDVTKRIQAQEAIRESEERFRNIVESTGMGMATMDENGKYLYVNKLASERLGFNSPEELIGKTMWDIFPKEIADRRAKILQRIISTGQSIIERNELVETHGTKHWYDLFIEPFSPVNEKIKSVLLIGRDVTELKLAEEKLSQYREKMTHAERLASLGTLSATAAHELAQPLTVISLSLENAITELEKKYSSNIVIKKLETCMSEVSNILTVINKFRNLARKSTELSINEVDFKAVAEMNVNLFRENAKKANIIMSIENLETLPHILANEKDMEQLFFCLIDNAIQAANPKEEHKLVISGALKKEQIELRFCDNCGGIAPENLDRLFEPFFTTKSVERSTDLGLCIVQDIAARAAGKIRVESKFGEGSTFIITLPLNNK